MQAPVLVAVIVANALSVLGGLFILVTYMTMSITFRNLKSRRLMMILGVCDAAAGVAYLIWLNGNPDDRGSTGYLLCNLQATMNIFFNQCSFLWTLFICFYLFLGRLKGTQCANDAVKYFHLITWGWSMLSTVLSVFFDVIGYNTNLTSPTWCWINTGALWWRLISGKLAEYATAITIISLNIWLFVDYKMKSGLRRSEAMALTRSEKNTQKADFQLIAVPIIFILLRIPGNYRSIYLTINKHGDSEGWVTFMQAIGDSSQGFANSLLFGLFSKKVREHWKTIFGRKKDQAINNSSTDFYRVAV